MTLFNTDDQSKTRANKPTSITRVLILVFRMTTLVLSPLIAVWMKFIVRDRREKLKNEIQLNMEWTLSNLHPKMIEVPSGSQKQHTFVVLHSVTYRIWIAMESYHGGQSYWAKVGPSCDIEALYPIDILERVLTKLKDAYAPERPSTLIRSLSDLDSAIRSLDPLLKEYLSQDKWEETRQHLDAYMKTEWERRSKRPQNDSRNAVPRFRTF